MAFVLDDVALSDPATVGGYEALKCCGTCKVLKPLFSFSKDKNRDDGLYPTCKPCKSVKNSAYRKRVAAQQKVYPESKTCAACKCAKPANAFKKCKDNLDGLYSYCTDCDKQKRQRMRYRVSYGFTHEQAEHLANNNVGDCAICGTHGKLFVDHCHTTSKVRGLVCNACNVVLGFAKDNPNTLRSAAKYLEDTK